MYNIGNYKNNLGTILQNYYILSHIIIYTLCCCNIYIPNTINNYYNNIICYPNYASNTPVLTIQYFV